MDYKMSLQAAENKRMQDHIVSVAEENRSLERRVEALEKRNKRLEDEVLGK